MASQVILKKSSVAARVPVAGDLAFGELALNYADGLLYYKKSDGTTIGSIGAGSSSVSELTDSVANWAFASSFAGSGNPNDVFFSPDGTKLFLALGNSFSRYILTTAWDTTTAGSGTSSAITWDSATYGMFISPDGTKLITSGSTAAVNAGLGIIASEDRAYYLTMSTPWDTSTATLVSSLRFTAGDAGLPLSETGPQGITFNSSGSIMYVVGSTNDFVYQYTLSTAYNVATATYVKQLTTTPYVTAGTGIRFNNAGTRMYITGSTGDSITEYRLTTAWDIATATYYDDQYMGNYDATPNGLFIDEVSNNAYLVGSTSDKVTRFITNSAGVVITPELTNGTGAIDLVGNTRIKSGDLIVNKILTVDGFSYFKGTLSAAGIQATQIATSTSSITLGGSITTGATVITSTQTTGTIDIGGAAGTGAITLGKSTVAQTLNLGTGATAAATTKVINIGTTGVSTSVTNINYGSSVTGALNTHTWNSGVNNMTLNASGNLGIGTATPAGKLEVTSGVVPSVAHLLIGYNGGSTNYFDANVNIWRDGSYSERMRITSAGALSFGSTGTAYGTLGQILQSNGNASPTWVNNATATSSYTRSTFTATAGQTVFTAAYTVGYVEVFYNGVLQPSAEYTATNGTSITLAVAATLNDTVETIAYAVSDIVPTGITTGKAIAMAMIFGG